MWPATTLFVVAATTVNLNEYNPTSGIGYTALRPRNIQSASQFERLFPKPNYSDPKTTKAVNTLSVVELCKQISLQTLADTAKVAPTLKADNLNQTLKNVWNFFYNHYQYKIDTPGTEQLRRPARAFADRKSGIDCDCFAISVSSFLTNLGIRHFFRIVKMYGKSYYQHIYVVVPKQKNSNLNNRSEYYVIDPVVDAYDFEPIGITFKTDVEMSIPVQYLNGVDDNNAEIFGTEFNGLGESIGEVNGELDGDALNDEFLGRLKRHISNSVKMMKKKPSRTSAVYKTGTMVQAMEGLLGVWDDADKRSVELERLSGLDDTFLQPHLQGFSDVLHGSDEELFGLMNVDDSEISGLGKLQLRKKATGSEAPKKKAGVFTAINNATKKVATVTKTAVSNAGTKVKTVAKNTGTKVKTAAKKVAPVAKKVVKKIGQQVVKNNPVILAARTGFLAAMKTNFGRIASRAYWGYFTAAEAAKAGVSASYHTKATQFLKKMEETFVGKLKGESGALKKAVITGLAARKAKQFAKKGKLNGYFAGAIDAIAGDGVGEITTATIAAATAFLVPLVSLANILFKGRGGKEETPSGKEEDSSKLDKDNNEGGETSGKSSNQNNGGSDNRQDEQAASTYTREVENNRGSSSADLVKDSNIQDNFDNGTLPSGAAPGGDAPADSGKSNTGLIVAGLATAAVVLTTVAVVASKKSKKDVNGIDGTTPACTTAAKVLRKSDNKFLKTTASRALNKCKQVKL